MLQQNRGNQRVARLTQRNRRNRSQPRYEIGERVAFEIQALARRDQNVRLVLARKIEKMETAPARRLATARDLRGPAHRLRARAELRRHRARRHRECGRPIAPPRSRRGDSFPTQAAPRSLRSDPARSATHRRGRAPLRSKRRAGSRRGESFPHGEGRVRAAAPRARAWISFAPLCRCRSDSRGIACNAKRTRTPAAAASGTASSSPTNPNR